MIKRITKLITMLLLIILIFPNKQVKAVGFSYGGMFNSGNNISIPGNDEPQYLYESSGDYTCKYLDNVATDKSVDINAYDMEGNSVVPFTKTTATKFKAGTWIGINLREVRSASWKIEIPECYKETKKYKYNKYPNIGLCVSSYKKCGDTQFDNSEECRECKALVSAMYGSECHGSGYFEENESSLFREEDKIAGTDDYKCIYYNAGEEPEIQKETENLPENIISEIKNNIAKKTVLSAISGIGLTTMQFEIYDPNDYTKGLITLDKEDIDNSKKFKSNPSLRPDCLDNVNECVANVTYSVYQRGAAAIYYEYTPKTTCIDRKTSKVSYKSKECSKKKYDEIANTEINDKYLSTDEKISFWHYFIPFNTPTSKLSNEDTPTANQFYISVSSENPTKSEIGDYRECKAILEKYPIIKNSNVINYTDLIVPVYYDSVGNLIRGEKFQNDYFGDKMPNNSKDMSLFINNKNYKCKVSVQLKFNIEQKFYGENKEIGAIKGYGFYYRPINPNEPFPNGIAVDSIWYKLYNNDNNKITFKKKENESTIEQTIDLKKAFDDITYSTRNVSRNDIIKIINKEEDNDNYTSWKNIEIDGTSKFLEEIHLEKNVKEIYKLGCGPDNANWEVCKQ